MFTSFVVPCNCIIVLNCFGSGYILGKAKTVLLLDGYNTILARLIWSSGNVHVLLMCRLFTTHCWQATTAKSLV